MFLYPWWEWKWNSDSVGAVIEFFNNHTDDDDDDDT